MSEIKEVYLTRRTTAGTLVRAQAVLEYAKGRIFFLKSPFALKDEIKAMKGSKWHGSDEDNPRKIWSIEDCSRNRFQLGFLMGEDVFEWFDRPIVKREYDWIAQRSGKSLRNNQVEMCDSGLTYHYQIWASEMGLGKTLSAQCVIEESGVLHWFWVGPKPSLPNMRREFRKWGFNFDGPIQITFMTYEGLALWADQWQPGDPVPQGLICDESSRVKGETSQRTGGAQFCADKIREVYGFDGYVIEMSGSPSPKSPLDWWSQCEIAWPGFLKEGSRKALEQRLAFMEKAEFQTGVVIQRRVDWRDDEKKCNVCGCYREEGEHEPDEFGEREFHKFVPSKNEVAYLYERLKGLVVVQEKKDYLDLPHKRYRKIICKPHPSTLRVAKAIADSASSTIVGLSLLRELSDGFQYREIDDGTTSCSHCPDSCGKVEEWFDKHKERRYESIDFLSDELQSRLEKRVVDCPVCHGKKIVAKKIRVSREVPCPKDRALKQCLDECEENGRIVIFGGFTASVDRIRRICHKEGWAVVRCDQGRYETSLIGEDGILKVITTDGEESLDYWADRGNPRVAFDANPESGGMSLTLTESRMSVYWSNSFKSEFRTQSEDRIHREGMDLNLGCEIVDLIHLPTDERVLEVIKADRQLELMTMGHFADALTDDAASEEEVLVTID